MKKSHRYLVSGEADVCARLEVDGRIMVLMEDEKREHKYSHIPSVFMEATDIAIVDAASDAEANKIHRKHKHRHDALKMLILSLDRSLDQQIRDEAMAELDDHLMVESTLAHVRSVLYSRPAAHDFLSEVSLKDSGPTFALLTDVLKHSEKIRSVYEAWKKSCSSFDLEVRHLAQADQVLIEASIFEKYVRSSLGEMNAAVVQFEMLVALRDIPNGRELGSAWHKEMQRLVMPGIKRRPSEVRENKTETDDGNDGERSVSGRRRAPRIHEKFTSVKSQMGEIERLLNIGEVERAKMYASQLVDQQVAAGDSAFAAKTLCGLAQMSRRRGDLALRKLWAEAAVKLAPGDGIAAAHFADALLSLNDFEAARFWYVKVGELGDQVFARGGLARSLRREGHLEIAEEKFEELAKEHPNEYHICLGRADVLRDRCKYDQSIEAYDRAHALAHDDMERNAALCHKASALRSIGSLNDAKAIYAEILRWHDDDSEAIAGLMDLLRENGDFKEVIKTFRHSADCHLKDYAITSVYARALKDMGEFDAAIVEYQNLTKDFPFIPNGLMGLAEVFKEKRDYGNALKLYQSCHEKFPYDVGALCGQANILRRMGRLSEALSKYEMVTRKYPHNLLGYGGQAAVLKELGRLPQALAMYQKIEEMDRHNSITRNGKAAVLLAMHLPQEALALLPAGSPRTKEDWYSVHIRAMAFIATSDHDRALKMYSSAVRECPFVSLQRFFSRGIALASIRLHNFKKAEMALAGCSDAVAAVMRMHAYAGLHSMPGIKQSYESIRYDCPENVAPLRDALARVYNLGSPSGKQTWQWIEEAEWKMALLSAA